MRYFVLFLSLIFIGKTKIAAQQDLSTNLGLYENGVLDGNWTAGTTTAQLEFSLCNNGSGDRGNYSIRPLISCGSSGTGALTFAATQTHLPAGWTVLSNTGGAIRLSNGTSPIIDGECYVAMLDIVVPSNTPTAIVVFSVNMGCANGVAPGNTPAGCSDPLPGNDNAPPIPAQVSSTVPLRLINFSATEKNCVLSFNWKTADEQNTSHFDLEQSADGISFRKAGTVLAQGNGSGQDYSYLATQDNTTVYYRLKMVDMDGAFKYSNVLRFTTGCNVNQQYFKVYPNPAQSDKPLSVTYKVNYRGKALLAVTDAVGRRVFAQQLEISGPVSQTIQLPVLGAGTYHVQLADNTGTNIMPSQKIIVQ